MKTTRLVILTCVCTLLGGWAAEAQVQPYLKKEFDTEGEAVRAAFAPVVAESRSGVVRLLRDGEPVALGTVVGEDGLVLTKASELKPTLPPIDEMDDFDRTAPEPELRAVLADGRTVAVEVLGQQRNHDLALLRVDAEGLVPIAWADADEPRLGQWVVVPGLEDIPEAIGVYSAPPRRINAVRLGIRFGPVHPDTDPRPRIGLTIDGMGAARAGLRSGDILLAIGGKSTPTVESVIETLRDANAGDVIAIIAERDGAAMKFDVEMSLQPLDPRSRRDRMNSMGNDLSRRRDGFARVFQHDATITPDLCGGPVLDLDGRGLGINIARAGRVEAYALPADVVRAVLEELQPPLMVNDDPTPSDAPQ